MGLEVYRKNPDLLADNIERNSVEKMHGCAYVFAGMIIGDASTELASLNRRPNTPMRGIMTENRPQDLDKNAFAYRRSLEAMVYFAATIQAVENIISTGVYDHYTFASTINHATGQYAGDKVVASLDEKPIPIDPIDLKLIQEFAQADPFFTIFFEDNGSLLPQKLCDTLDKSGHVDSIRKMLQDYREITDGLPKKESSLLAQPDYQTKRLEVFDEMISQRTKELDELRATMTLKVRKRPNEIEAEPPKSGVSQNWIDVIASALIKDGEITYKRFSGAKKTTADPRHLTLIEKRLDIAKTKVFFGSILLSIEDMIRTGEYNHTKFATSVNMALGEGAIKISHDDAAAKLILDPNYYRFIVSFAQEDPTLAVFFHDPLIFLPSQIHQEIEKQDLAKGLEQILSSYREHARQVIDIPHDTIALKAKQEATLSYYSGIIDDLDTKLDKSI